MEQKENENKRNTVLLTVIGIATLLVAIVGATFAYFTAKTTSDGEGASGRVTTANIGGATVTFTGEASKFELLDYPGGLGVYGSSATISKTKSENDNNNYSATYNLQIDYINETGTELDWELYVVDGSIKDDLSADKTTICKLQENKENGDTRYWYADGTGVSESQNNDSCTGSALINKITTTLNGKKLATGKLLSGKNENKTITKDTKSSELSLEEEDSNLSNRTLSTNGTNQKYYYLIVKYPNDKQKDQSLTDAGKQITVTLSLEEGSVQSTVAAA